MANWKALSEDQIEAVKIADSLLLPCPFCGEVPQIRLSNDYTPCYGIDHYCGQDSCIIVELRWKETPGEVVTSWNTRARMEDDK